MKHIGTLAIMYAIAFSLVIVVVKIVALYDAWKERKDGKDDENT